MYGCLDVWIKSKSTLTIPDRRCTDRNWNHSIEPLTEVRCGVATVILSLILHNLMWDLNYSTDWIMLLIVPVVTWRNPHPITYEPLVWTLPVKAEFSSVWPDNWHPLGSWCNYVHSYSPHLSCSASVFKGLTFCVCSLRCYQSCCYIALGQ